MITLSADNQELEIMVLVQSVCRSLGCIVYELLVGSPPFCTSSILHLVRLIRHEAVKWPDFISPTCQSFIQVRQFFILTLVGFSTCMNSFILVSGLPVYCFQIGFTTKGSKAAIDMATVAGSSICEKWCPDS
jgi:hypothetical protein